MDTPVDARALWVHRPFLQALARQLISSAHPDEPEDLVQEAYARALARPPRQAAALRSWLATTTRRLALNRGERRELQRGWERSAARPETLGSTAGFVEREALRRLVVEAVLALDEPARQVILLRFYEDLAPRHIARQLELPVETVRSRLRRALARLAERLDGQHPGGRGAWCTALAPLAWPAAGPSVAAGAAAARSPVVPGAVPGVVPVVVLGLVTLGAWWITGTLTSTATPDAVVAATPPVAGNASAAASPAATDGAATRLVASTTGAALTLTVRDATSDAGLADLPVFALGLPMEDPLDEPGSAAAYAERVARAAAIVTRTDATGRATIAGLTPGFWYVGSGPDAERSTRLHALLAVARDTQAAEQLAARADLVALGERFGHPDDPSPTLELLALAVDAGQTLDLVRPVGASSRPWSAAVIDERGRPVAEATATVLDRTLARLALEVFGPPVLTERLASLLDTPALSGSTGVSVSDGGGLWIEAPGHVPEWRRVTAGPPDDGPIVLRRLAPLSLAGQVLDPDGTARAGTLLSLHAAPAPPIADHAAHRDQLARHPRPHVVSDASGAFAFQDVSLLAPRTSGLVVTEGQRLELIASHPEGRVVSHALVTLAERSRPPLTLELAAAAPRPALDVQPATRQVQAVDERGRPVLLHDGRLDLGLGGDDPLLTLVAVDQPPAIGARPATLSGSAVDARDAGPTPVDGEDRWIAALVDGQVAGRVAAGTGGDTVLVPVPVDALRRELAGLAVQLVDTHGRSVPARVTLYADGSKEPALALPRFRPLLPPASDEPGRLATPTSGRVRCGAVPGGVYDLLVTALDGSLVPVRLPDVALQAGQRRFVTLASAPGTRLTLECHGAGSFDGLVVGVQDAAGHPILERQLHPGPLVTLDGLPPGPCTLAVSGPDGHLRQVPLTIAGRERECLELELEGP